LNRTLPSSVPESESLSWPRRVWHLLRAGLLGGAAVTAAGLAAHHIATDASFEVYEVRFVGAERAEILGLRHLTDLRWGEHLAGADLTRAVNGVERHPWVARATARRVFPSTIEVRIEEHEPVLLLALGGLWYLDSTGTPFRQAQADDLDYPVLTGLNPSDDATHPALVSATVRTALGVVAAASEHPHLTPDTISQLHFDQERGFTVVLRSGSELLLGWHAPEAPFERLARMVDAGLDLGTPQRIDLASDRLAIATPLAG